MYYMALPNVIDKYIKNTKSKHNKNKDRLNKEIIESTLNAMILSLNKYEIHTDSIKDEIRIYNFAGFNIKINKDLKIINDIYWDDEKNHKNINNIKIPYNKFHKIRKGMGLNSSCNGFNEEY